MSSVINFKGFWIMFGLEKKDKKPFEFDLEKEVRKDDKRKKEILDQIEKRTQELKGALREGRASENFDKCGIFLQGYAALSKVINRACRK